MSVSSRYREAWEGFWREAPDGQGAVFWDAAPAQTVALHLALFEPKLRDPGLQMVDLGCGNGTQTRFLADRFTHVVGADLSAAAVDHARQADPAGQATYRVLDATDKTDVEALHAELGDANVYMRGVLHQADPDDRQPLIDGVATLVGSAAMSSSSNSRRPPARSSAHSPRTRRDRRRNSPRSSATASRPARSPTTRCPNTSARPVSPFSRAANSRCSQPSSGPTAHASNCRRSGTSRAARAEGGTSPGAGPLRGARAGVVRCPGRATNRRPRGSGTARTPSPSGGTDMPRPPSRHGPGFEIRRQKIIDTAASLFARQGYAATSINDLGRAVGLAKGALYYYIGSKENLLIEIQSRVLDPLLARAQEIAALDEPPLLRLRLLSESLLTTIFRRLDHIRVYEHDHRSLSGAELETVLGQRADFELLITGLLTEAVEAGTFRAVEPHLATRQFLNLHHHTYQWVRPDGSWDAAFLSGEYCSTLFRGFAASVAQLPDVEALAAEFKRSRPDLPLDPETAWQALPVAG